MSEARKSIVVTGASSGIGHACVTRLLRAGWLVFAGVRKTLDAERLRREGGEQVRPIAIDVTDKASIEGAVGEVREQLGGRGLDALVNNAGIGIAAPVEYIADDVLRRQFDVNVFGQIAVTQAFLPLIRAAHGRIVNMGSVGSHLSLPFGGALCASKSAFRSLNDALRLELHPFGIDVVMIEPGAIRTLAVEKTLGDPDAVVGALPPEGVARYGRLLRDFMRRGYERETKGSPPEVVADKVYEALTATRPRPTYLAGKDARLFVTIPRLLSDRLLDRLRLRLFGIPSVPSP
jgi:NAD(P)-dependent dehydrogenase (short-subunit alcohol dehydrogenase family)